MMRNIIIVMSSPLVFQEMNRKEGREGKEGKERGL
jgi:hypothetical protein